VKIWWCGGQLIHIHPQDELYTASFRPKAVDQLEPFPTTIPPPPEINESVKLYMPKGESSTGRAFLFFTHEIPTHEIPANVSIQRKPNLPELIDLQELGEPLHPISTNDQMMIHFHRRTEQ